MLADIPHAAIPTDGPKDHESAIKPSMIEPGAVLSRKEIRRGMLYMAKASFRDGVSPPYTTLRNGGDGLPFVHPYSLTTRRRAKHSVKSGAYGIPGPVFLDKLGVKGKSSTLAFRKLQSYYQPLS
jgi:hypothetical protein